MLPVRQGGLMLLLMLLAGCAGNVRELYDAEKDAVLGRPGKVPEDWAPDIRLQISDSTVQSLAEAAVNTGILDVKKTLEVEGPLGLTVRITPRAETESLTLAASTSCEACLAVTASLHGNARWAVGPAKGSLPWSADLSAVLRLASRQREGAMELEASLTDVRGLSVRAGKARAIEVGPALKGWAKGALAKAPPLALGRIGGKALPIRRLRFSTADGHVEVQALSDVPGWAPVAPVPPPRSGWSVALSEATVGALLRRETFKMGLLDHNIALDPRAIDFDGDRFALDLRLWRLQGAGWWRDYTVKGHASIAKGKLKLKSTEATEGDTSKGAGFADPLALLLEQRILEEVAKGVRQAVPASKQADLRGATLKARTTRLETHGDALVLVGSASLE